MFRRPVVSAHLDRLLRGKFFREFVSHPSGIRNRYLLRITEEFTQHFHSFATTAIAEDELPPPAVTETHCADKDAPFAKGHLE